MTLEPLTTATTAGVPAGRVVDLTHVLLPGREQYTLEVSRRSERHGPEGDIMSTVYMWSHVGTHVEAPLHFLADGGGTAAVALDRLMGPAVVCDFRAKEVNEPITVEDFQRAGDIREGDRVITMTGRDHQYRTEASHDRPYIAEDACRWLVEDRRIKAFGTDSSGFEVRTGHDRYVNHRLALGAGVPIIECLRNLQELRTRRIFLIALPWPVKGLDACPVRAVAIEPEDEVG